MGLQVFVANNELKSVPCFLLAGKRVVEAHDAYKYVDNCNEAMRASCLDWFTGRYLAKLPILQSRLHLVPYIRMHIASKFLSDEQVYFENTH